MALYHCQARRHMIFYTNTTSYPGDSNICGSVSRSTAGSFGSPDRNGDGLYDHNVDCFWNLTADDNHVVLLRIWRVDIKSRDDDGICRHDGLEVKLRIVEFPFYP